MSRSSRICLLPLAALAASAPAQAKVYLSIEDAQRAMFGDQAMTARPLTLDAAQMQAIEQASGVPVRGSLLRAWRAGDGGWFLLDAVIGKSELITYALGLDAQGRIKQVEVLEYRESHGGEIRYPGWRKQFVDKTAGNALRIGDDIDGISGATLSCEHVTDGIRRLVAAWALVLKPLG
ncbi:FMN-binding protein [Nevskia sp.]|uniref:FMN-binding protein n=1 Tax=Nevskia sp. TaxID=1929292 RepID=UPI003F71283B